MNADKDLDLDNEILGLDGSLDGLEATKAEKKSKKSSKKKSSSIEDIEFALDSAEFVESELQALEENELSEEEQIANAFGSDFDEESLYRKSLAENSEDTEALALTDSADMEQKAFAGFEVDSNLSEGSELAGFDSADIVEEEFIEIEKVESLIESLLFVSDKPISLATIKQLFVGTNVKTDKIKSAIEKLQIEYASAYRGVSLEEVAGGYQIRTKLDNLTYLKRLNKQRSFKLSGPALEVLAIVAYKQPLIKNEVDQIRGVESGHLMRALLDRKLIRFAGKSELPGKPMLYETTRSFLEIFGLRNIKELPSLSEIDELIPEGIGAETEEEKQSLSDVTQQLGREQGSSYSESEEELTMISDQLSQINPNTEFFEEEKRREKEKREAQKAQDIREAIAFGELVEKANLRWLEKYEEKLKLAEEAKLAAQNAALNPVQENASENIDNIHAELAQAEAQALTSMSVEQSLMADESIESLEQSFESLANAVRSFDNNAENASVEDESALALQSLGAENVDFDTASDLNLQSALQEVADFVELAEQEHSSGSNTIDESNLALQALALDENVAAKENSNGLQDADEDSLQNEHKNKLNALAKAALAAFDEEQ